MIKRLILILLLLVLFSSLPTFAASVIDNSNNTSTPVQSTGTISVNTSASGTFTYVGFEHTITIVDADLNTTPGPGNDTVPVVITNVTDGTVANINLPETTSTGVFRGTFVNTTAPVSLAPNEVIRFRYNDANPAGSRDVTFNSISTTAAVSVSPTSAPPGSTFTITLNDPDRNLTIGGGNDTINVVARNNADGGGANVPLTLQESSTAGVFTGTLVNTSDVLDDNGGTIPTTVGDEVRISYNDVFDSFGNPQSPFAIHTLSGTDGVLTVTPNDEISGKGVLTIRVVDIDLNLNAGGSNDNTPIRVIPNNVGADSIVFQLPETTTAGTFQGTFDLANFTGGAELTYGEIATVRYRDLSRADGTTDVLIEVDVDITAEDAVIIAPSTASIANGFTVSVDDEDRNATAGPGNNNANVQVQFAKCNADLTTCSANQPIQLAEDDTLAGFFSRETGILTAIYPALVNGERIRIQYTDTIAADGTNGVLRETSVLIVAGADATFAVNPILTQPATTVTATVTDADRSGMAGAGNDSVNITARNVTQNGAVATFTVPESSTEGVFSLGVSIGDFGLNARVGDQIEFIYTDPTPNGGGAPVEYKVIVNVRNLGQDSVVEIDGTIPGRPAQIRVTDPETSITSNITVNVRNTTTNGTVEPVTLSYDSTIGKFTGSINTAFGRGNDGAQDGVINVVPGNVLQATYQDVLTSNGFDRAFTDTATIQDRRAATIFCDRGTTTNDPVWFAQYYNSTNLTGDVVESGEEGKLNINYAETAPFRSLPADNWSARWTTTMDITEDALYRFRFTIDDGVRFYINEELVLDQFSNGTLRTVQADYRLTPGRYTMKVEYFEGDGNAQIKAECYYIENPVLAIDTDGNTVSVIPSNVNFDEAIAHITTGRINVRANPTVTAAWLDYVYIYQRYDILGITDDGAWYLIDLKDGRSGWVAERYVKRYDTQPVQIYPSWSGTETVLPNVEVAGYATAEIKIRTAPRSGDQIGVVPANGAFRVYARTASGAWYRIAFEGIEGWVFAPYVELTNGTVQDLNRE